MMFTSFRLGLFFLALGITATLFAGFWRFYDQNNLSFAAEPTTLFSPLSREPKLTRPPINLSIPSGKINVPIVEGTIKNGVWPLSPKDVIHLSSSPFPGENGRIIIYGHDSASILANLKTVKPGSQVLVTSEDGTVHVYQVSESLTVSPRDIYVLNQTDRETLTIYTCTGPFDSQRLVVQAYPIGQILSANSTNFAALPPQ